MTLTTDFLIKQDATNSSENYSSVKSGLKIRCQPLSRITTQFPDGLGFFE
jgi:hypothetical protein